jgi:hypothetical protein
MKKKNLKGKFKLQKDVLTKFELNGVSGGVTTVTWGAICSPTLTRGCNDQCASGVTGCTGALSGCPVC